MPDSDSETAQRRTARMSEPALIGSGRLTAEELAVDERIRTLCLVVIALSVVAAASYYLEHVLIPFVIALALKYLMTPLINMLACHNTSCPIKLPRGIAIILAFAVVLWLLSFLSVIVLRSIAQFTSESEVYRERVEELWTEAVLFMRSVSAALGVEEPAEEGGEAPSLAKQIKSQVTDIAQSVSVTDIILAFLGSAAHVTENLIYIVLFLAFLLASHEPSKPDGDEPSDGAPAMARRASTLDKTDETAERQIFTYIRGKTSISLLVASLNGLMLWMVGLDLALVFALLSFWLNVRAPPDAAAPRPCGRALARSPPTARHTPPTARHNPLHKRANPLPAARSSSRTWACSPPSCCRCR